MPCSLRRTHCRRRDDYVRVDAQRALSLAQRGQNPVRFFLVLFSSVFLTSHRGQARTTGNVRDPYLKVDLEETVVERNGRIRRSIIAVLQIPIIERANYTVAVSFFFTS